MYDKQKLIYTYKEFKIAYIIFIHTCKNNEKARHDSYDLHARHRAQETSTFTSELVL